MEPSEQLKQALERIEVLENSLAYIASYLEEVESLVI